MATQGIRVKLLQLNAWAGRLEPQIGDMLREEQPDILCLQEAISFNEKGSGLFLPTETIQNDHDLPHGSFGPVFSFKLMRATAHFGNGVFSKFPIAASETVFTHMEYKDDFMWDDDSANIRNFVHTELMIDGTPCHILTHHGYWVAEHKNGTDETVRQMRMIADYIATLSGPVILTGDFNLVPESDSIQVLNKVLHNLTLEYGLATTRTELTHKTEACDYIFVNDQVRVHDFKALDKIVSDHQALVLEFDI